MITRYIGTPDDFINCEAVGFMMVENNNILSPSAIPEYTVYNSVFNRHILVNRNSDGLFIADFRGEPEGFILNNLVMYNSFGEPLGYVDLTQNIDITKYKIETIELSFDMVIINKHIDFNYNVNYNPHLLRTSNKLAHKNLFENALGGYRAVNKPEVTDIVQRQLFTKNLISSRHNKNLLYRYSGNLSRDITKFSNVGWTLKTEYVIDSIYLELVEIDSVKYIFSYNNKDGGTLNIITMGGAVTTVNMPITSSLHIGSNFILSKSPDGSQIIYPTSEVVLGILNPIKLGTMGLSNDLVTPTYKICKNPLTKELMCYYKKNGKFISNDKLLSKYIDDFKSLPMDDDLLYAAEGLLFTGKLDNDILTSANYFTFPLPGNKSSNKLVPCYSDKSASEADELKLQFDNLLIGSNIKDVIFITTELMVVNKDSYTLEQFRSDNKNTWTDKDGRSEYIKTTYPIGTDDEFTYYIDYDQFDIVRGAQKYLIEVSSYIDYEINSTTQFHKLKLRSLMGRSGLMNYSYVIKSYMLNIKDYDFLSLSSEGCILAFKNNGEYCNVIKI